MIDESSHTTRSDHPSVGAASAEPMRGNQGCSKRRIDRCFLLLAGAILLCIAALYGPLYQAAFVWDDRVLLHDNAWLQSGHGAWRAIFLGPADWRYFRPLGLGLFALELRWFGALPAPMHLLSILLHLVNTALVGALGWRLSRERSPAADPRWAVAFSMAVFGLHPVIVEAVAWIAAQFDLLSTMFILAGLLLDRLIAKTWLRAALVAVCFFLAACAKESAIVFPALLVLLEWMRPVASAGSASGWGARLRSVLRRQGASVLAAMAAGLVYMALRTYFTGNAAAVSMEPLFTWARLQTVCHVLVACWKLIVFPFAGLNPHHIVDPATLATASAASIATCAAAIAILAAGAWLTMRGRASGVLIACVTAAVFPTLHVVPIHFDESLYHDRYLLSAAAIACAIMPMMLLQAWARASAIVRRSAGALAALWLALAIVTVRTTVPLWFNDTRMWEWGLRGNPESTFVMENLMGTYLGTGDIPRARAMANDMLQNASHCPDCMMDVAKLAILQGDADTAARALDAANQHFTATPVTHARVLAYILINGDLYKLRGEFAQAEAAYRDATTIIPTRPDAYFELAWLLAQEGGHEAEARRAFEAGAARAVPDVVASLRPRFERLLASHTSSSTH
ncbi:MAG: hypothetical protein JSR26_01445 [Proteobacteria bacterium]|nr:hypothetical protein [Pseudomonadota bacterium]